MHIIVVTGRDRKREVIAVDYVYFPVKIRNLEPDENNVVVAVLQITDANPWPFNIHASNVWLAAQKLLTRGFHKGWALGSEFCDTGRGYVMVRVSCQGVETLLPVRKEDILTENPVVEDQEESRVATN